MSEHWLKALLGRGGQTHIYKKGVTVRFGFDGLRTSQLQQYVKNKATGTPLRVYYIYSSKPVWYFLCHNMRRIYIVTSAWGFQRCSFRHTGQCEGL